MWYPSFSFELDLSLSPHISMRWIISFEYDEAFRMGIP